MLEVSALTLRYPNGALALTDFSISAKPGELVIVLGANGSGKSTLLRCISRVLSPASGEIRVNGEDLARLSGERLRRARLELASISQRAALVRRRSVLANVATGALGRYCGIWTALGGLPRAELEAARGYLEQVGLAHLAERRAANLSGGQAQRVAIARALAQRPRVLLADEPIASLDPEAAEEIMRLLRRLAREDNLAIVCVLHQVELACAYADRLVGIRTGRVVFDTHCAQVSRDAVRLLYLSAAE